MATVVLSAAGAALGGALGGSAFGLSSVVIGRAVGATLGRVLDQRLMGQGSQTVEVGRLDRFRIAGAGEGGSVAQSYGRTRLAGQVIWATRFKETATTSGGGGGKGGARPSQPETTTYSYSVSLAAALCEGEITSVGRVWADGAEIDASALNLRVYTGSATQAPDPLIEAVEGAGTVPAYRGLAYVVIEDLQLGAFGNRVPQLSFEVIRPADPALVAQDDRGMGAQIDAVAIIPGTGEYSLSTTPVSYTDGIGYANTANVHTPSGGTDFSVSLKQMTAEMPNCQAASLVVSWFGDDLRAGSCQVQPKVEQTAIDGNTQPWQVAGITRAQSGVVPFLDGGPVYGGTPADISVIEGIQALRARGQRVMFYPFILMEQMAGNSLTDPWTGASGQPVLPWRGRITTSLAPGVPGSPDGTATAASEVAAFLGTAQPGDFGIEGSRVTYSGPAEWSFRRFILHYAHVCAAAGGVDAFCIGSELRALTQIRGAGNTFPFVDGLIQLAQEVRAILGPATKISYAADWSEYFGYQPQDGSGDVFFHLDPLWARPEIDFIGIDNYMRLADWRDGSGHADESFGTTYSLDYLRGNIAGGEGFDWYYASDADRDAQVRTPITDGAHGEPWVFRYKDLEGWWRNAHHNRIGGVRQASPTAWVPQSKPFWFTELGCAAIDKGANQPNKFIDPKSSESATPFYSNGSRDDLIQAQFLRAHRVHWTDPATNPVSAVYGGPMVDPANAYIWAWDARPYPAFPQFASVWSDAANYRTGHWLNGRTSSEALGAVITEICRRAGLVAPDVSRVHGLVRGYMLPEVDDARASLQPLMLAYGVDAVDRGGQLRFTMREGAQAVAVPEEALVEDAELEGTVEVSLAATGETPDRVRLTYVKADGQFEVGAVETAFPEASALAVAQSEVTLTLTDEEARATTERWLTEARVARETARFALSRSDLSLGVGDVVQLQRNGTQTRYRLDRADVQNDRVFEATRVDGEVYRTRSEALTVPAPTPYVPPTPPLPIFLDLPILRSGEPEHAPYLAVTAVPWTGPVSVYASPTDSGYTLRDTVGAGAIVGITETDLAAAKPGQWDLGPALRVRFSSGALSSVSYTELFAGGNAFAIGDPSKGVWEVFQAANAELVAAGTYALGRRLRGQRGTEAEMPAVWPSGSTVVRLDSAVQPLAVAPEARGLDQHYRIGPASLPLSDPAYTHVVRSFDGRGLRPYAPVHLRAATSGGDLRVSWVRRSRVDGDSWLGLDVPLGEAREAYLVRVTSGQTELRMAEVNSPEWTYTAAMQATDGATGSLSLHVAQLSDRYGPGPETRIEINV